MKKYKVVFEYEIEAETKEEAREIAINQVQINVENGDMFPDKIILSRSRKHSLKEIK